MSIRIYSCLLVAIRLRVRSTVWVRIVTAAARHLPKIQNGSTTAGIHRLGVAAFNIASPQDGRGKSSINPRYCGQGFFLVFAIVAKSVSSRGEGPEVAGYEIQTDRPFTEFSTLDPMMTRPAQNLGRTFRLLLVCAIVLACCEASVRPHPDHKKDVHPPYQADRKVFKPETSGKELFRLLMTRWAARSVRMKRSPDFSKFVPYTIAPRLVLMRVSRFRAGRWSAPKRCHFPGSTDYPPRFDPTGKRMVFVSVLVHCRTVHVV